MTPYGIVESFCDYTGVMVRPWAEAGYDCYCYDLRPYRVLEEKVGLGFIHHFVWDVRCLDREKTRESAISFAFPPCTDLAVSGAAHFKNKGMRALIGALEVVEACRELCEAGNGPWMLENPIGTLASYWRAFDYSFDPWEYSAYLGGKNDAYPKKTCLWTGGGFVMPTKKALGLGPLFGDELELDDRIHQVGPSAERGNLRAVTPAGFARAVFEANCKLMGATHDESR